MNLLCYFFCYDYFILIVWNEMIFYIFSILAFKVFRYSDVLFPFWVLSRIRPFSGTHTDSTIFRYSFGHLFDTRTDSTFTR